VGGIPVFSDDYPQGSGCGIHRCAGGEWLAQLRLNESKNVIKDMETSMDIGVSTIAVWSEIRPPDEKTHKARDRFLTSVKVYHESYPASGDVAARVNSLLATVPGRNPQNTCKSGVCRLDDLRLAILHTNSP
jgi:hypothetical protein